MLVIVFATDENTRPLGGPEREQYKDQIHQLVMGALQEPHLTSIDIAIVPPGVRVKVGPEGDPS